MKQAYSFSQCLIVHVFLSLFLPSCSHPTNPFPHIQQGYEVQTSKLTPTPSSFSEDGIATAYVHEEDELADQLIEKSFIADGGYLVRFTREDGKWLALVQPSEAVASNTYQVPVHIAPEMHLAALLTLNEFWQRRRIHVIFQEQNGKRIPVCVHVGSMGLPGGGGSSSKDSCPYANEEAIWVSAKNAWMCRGKVHYRDKPEHIRLAEEEAQRKKEEQRRREEQRKREEQRRKEEQQKIEADQRKREEERQRSETERQKREETERKRVEEEQHKIKEMRAQDEKLLEEMAAQTKLHMKQMEQEWKERQQRSLEEFQREEERKQAEEQFNNMKLAALQEIANEIQESEETLESLNRVLLEDIDQLLNETELGEEENKIELF